MAVSIGFFWPHFIKSVIAVKEFFYTQLSVLKFSKKKSFNTQFALTSGIMKAKIQNQRFLKGYLNNNKSDEQTFPKILLQCAIPYGEKTHSITVLQIQFKIHIKKKVAMNYYSTEATCLYCTNNICLQITCYIIQACIINKL